MTMMGPVLKKKCLQCSGMIKQYTYHSHNTFSAKLWTDGYSEAISSSDFMKCPHCNSSIWMSELETVEEIDMKMMEKLPIDIYFRLKKACVPVFNDYVIELNRKSLSESQKLTLRMRAWWAGNDTRRYLCDKQNREMSGEELKNLHSLDEIIYATDERNRLMKAEIKRELGEFKEAKSLLREPFEDESYFKNVDIIRRLIKCRNQFVEEIKE